MALEEIIAANTASNEKLLAATERQTAILEKLLSAGAKNTAAAATAPAGKAEAAAPAPAGEDKPKTTKPKAEKPADTKVEVTVETLDTKFRPWLAEFAKDHPETAARRAKFKEMLGKLGAEKMSGIEDPAKLVKLDNWFETKAKSWDEGHGVGRFAADPEEGGEEGGDDEL